MSSKVLTIVENSFIQDKLIAEEELMRLIMNNDMDIDVKVESIKSALADYRDSIINITYWKDYVSTNIITPGQNDTGAPQGDNNTK